VQLADVKEIISFFFQRHRHVVACACETTWLITGQIVGTHGYPLRTSTVKRPRGVKAIMTAAAISVRAFVSINARLFIRIQFISTVTCAAITAWVVNAGIIAVRWYMQLEVQRTFQGGRKVSGLSNSGS